MQNEYSARITGKGSGLNQFLRVSNLGAIELVEGEHVFLVANPNMLFEVLGSVLGREFNSSEHGRIYDD